MFIDTWHWRAQANLLLQAQFHLFTRGTVFVFFTLKTARLPVTLGSILLKVKQLVWKMHRENWNVPFTSPLPLSDLHFIYKTRRWHIYLHRWLNVHFYISEYIGWFGVTVFVFYNSRIVFCIHIYYGFIIWLSACFFILSLYSERINFLWRVKFVKYCYFNPVGIE